MAEGRGGSERKNYLIKTLLIVILLLLALLSTVLYVYAYPKTTVTLYSVCNNNQEKESVFKIKKYSPLGNVKPIEKFGYNFEYWSYDMNGTTRLDTEKEVDTDYLDLFGMYTLKEFNIRLWIQEYEEDTAQDKPVLYKTYENIKFNSTIQLPTGLDDYGVLISQLSARTGYHFVGWTTKVDEEDVVSSEDVTLAGADYRILLDSDVDLYAYWEKNEYSVVTHTGNEYLMINGVPMRDSNGEFVIRNNRVQETTTIKYLDDLTSVTGKVKAELSEVDSMINAEGVNIMDHLEYEFVGWYLDEELTIPANSDDLVVKVNIVDGVEIPYLEFKGDSTKNCMSIYNEETEKYEFHLYSKWKRTSYTLSFNKNSAGSSGKIEDITIYKYDDHYGKYYQTEVFSRDNQDSEYFYQLDLSSTEITTEKFLSSNSGYRFIGWSTTPKTTAEDAVVYYKWVQDEVGGNQQYQYIDTTYTHSVSEDVTLYAQWARIRYVTFRERESSSSLGQSFAVEGIAGEWFKLPGRDYIENTLGWSINTYTYFAGWRTSSVATPIREFNTDGTENENYYWTFSSSSSYNVTLYAYWEKSTYTVIFDLNYEGSEPIVKEVTGGTSTTFPSAPTRDGYIFDGWSKTQYPDNTLNKTDIYTSANRFTASGDSTEITYYAAWTKNYIVEYNANGGEGKLPTSWTYAKNNGKDLKLKVTIGSGGQLTRQGYTFTGWALKVGTDLNKDFLISPNSSIVFNFNPVTILNADGTTMKDENGKDIVKYYCYKENQSATTYEFELEGDILNTVVLYACWKANEYVVNIIDTVDDDSKISFNVSYGTDVDLSQYITQHIGYKFIGLSTSKNGTSFAYTPGNMKLSGTSIFANYTFYARYEVKNINLKYMIIKADSSEVEYTPSSSYSQGVIKYGSTVILPTPTPSDYGDVNYKFSHWYYIESGEQIPMYSNTQLKVDVDELILYASYEEQIFTMEFKFVNPLDLSDTITITLDSSKEPYKIKKGDTISLAHYQDVMAQIEALIEERDIKEYTLKGLFSTYNSKTTEFVQGQLVNSSAFPILDTTGVVTFVTQWTPNTVEFVYLSSDLDDAEVITGYHTGQNYESNSDIILEDIKFETLGSGESVNRWYILNSDGEKKYFNKGDYLIKVNGEFNSISDLCDYIDWAYKDGVGTILIYAETQQVFTIEYYRFKDGSIENLSDYSTTHIYDTLSNTILLESGSIATANYGDIIFNGWRVYNSNGLVTSIGENGLVTTSLTLDPEVFTDFNVKLYADLSYRVIYSKLTLEDTGAFTQEVLSTETISLATGDNPDYSSASSYVTLHTINTIVDMGEVPSGYEFYGYKIGDEIILKDDIEAGFNIDVTGEDIEILCYLVKLITITYSLSDGQAFADNSTESKVFTYVLGYDDTVIAERSDSVDTAVSVIKIKNLTVSKEGYNFVGWAIERDGEIYAEIYKPNQEVIITIDTKFIALLEEPDAGTINAVIKYVDEEGNTLYEDNVAGANGTTYTLISGDDSRINFVSQTKGITGWSYDGIAVNSNTFNIPLQIDEGQVFTFVAIIKDKYTISFETYSEDTVDNIVVFEGVETRLTELPTLDNGKTFLNWAYDISTDADNPNLISIDYDDAIMFKASTEDAEVKYSSSESVKGYTLHIIPVISGQYLYTFYAVGEDISLTLIIGISDGDVTYTLTDVKYGASYTVRELVELSGFDTYESDISGIAGWTLDSSRRYMTQYTADEQAALINNINNITNGESPLYAVWQTKHTLTYAVESDSTEYGYRDEAGNTITHDNEYFFAGDTITFNAEVIKSIYYKGYNTVYYDDGRYIVYAGNESSTDYYEVSGFYVYTSDGSLYIECVFADGEYSFTAPGANVTIVPRAKSVVYQVTFDENSSSTSNILYTEYVSDLSEIDLSKYTAKRSNFTFVGWNTEENRNSDEVLTSLDSIEDANITLYAIWNSTLSASFAINGNVLFSVPYTRTSSINESVLNSYLMMVNQASNGYFNYNPLNENTRTYKYNGILYYLNSFSYNSKTYDSVEKLCALTLDRSVVVNIMLNEVYTIKYTETNSVGIDVELEEFEDYIVANSTDYGRINSTGNTDSLVFATYNKENDYYTANGWKDTAGNIYSFGSTASNLSFLVSLADNSEITLNLNYNARSFQVILNGTDNPQALYSTISSDTATSADWTDVTASYLRDATGNTFPAGDVYIQYGSEFVIIFPSTAINNYQIIGWSTKPYALGDDGDYAEDIYYSNDYIKGNGLFSSDTLTLSDSMLGTDTVLRLYPVFKLVASHTFGVVSEGGEFTYSITNDTSILTGFMVDSTSNVGEKVSSNAVIELAYYQVLTITANLPNANYVLEGIYNNEEKLDGDIYTFVGNTVCEDCTHGIDVVYEPKTINVTTKLVYTRELQSSVDTSEVQIGNITLSYTHNSDSLTILANQTLDILTSISSYFTLSSITDGEGTVVNLVNNQIVVAELNIDDNNNVEIIFTLAPKSFNVDFILQGGVLESFEYSSEDFGNGEILLNGETRVQVIAGATITIPTPTKEKSEFAYFMVNGVRYDSISEFPVNSNLSITAYFIQNKFSITYYFNNGGWQRVDFTGGSEITIGEGITGYEEVGIKHIGWKSESDLTDSKYTYVDDDTLTTEKIDYTLYEVVEGEDITLEFVFSYGEEERTLVHKDTSTNSITVKYSTPFNLPVEDDFTNASIENMALYGFRISEDSDTIYTSGRSIHIAPDGDIQYTYPESGEAKVTLYTVYYKNYTYIFDYTNTETTTIDSATKEVVAVDSTGSVLSTDLKFTLDTQVPVSSDNTVAFAGYEVYINGTKQTDDNGDSIIVSAGETIDLINPAIDSYEVFSYTYTLKAVFDQADGAAELRLYIVDPVTSEYLTLNDTDNELLDDNGINYYPIYTFLTNQFYSSSLPTFDYSTLSTTAEWKSGTKTIFTTSNDSNLVAFKLLGFKLEKLNTDGNVTDTIEILFSNENGYNLGAATRYILIPIWEDRYFVRYYDMDGNAISDTDTYYDIGAILKVDADSTKYSKEGYVFVGYASSYDKTINTTSDFMSFETEFEITNAHYYFHPAFSKVYNVTFNTNLDTLENALGDSDKVETIKENALSVYVGMSEVTLTDYLQLLYNDIGYSFEGYFTLTKDSMYNDLTVEQVFKTYTFSITDLVNDSDDNDEALTIYVAWTRASHTVSFVLTARLNNSTNSYADSTVLEITYLFNENIDFDDERIVAKINSLNDYFEFENFSLVEDGDAITSYTVKSDATIYANYSYLFTIVYNLGDATYLEGSPEVDTPKKLLGENLVGYDADAYLFLEGRDNLYWSTLGTLDNFFEGGYHSFSTSDLKVASEYYVINLYLNSSIAAYTVNLYFFENVANFNLHNEGTADGYSMVTAKIEYGSTILTITPNEDYTAYTAESPFDSAIEEYFNQDGKNGDINTLLDLFNMFESVGYRFTGNVSVNNEYTTGVNPDYNPQSYYTVQTYSGSDAYVNNVYLLYTLQTYRLDVKSMVIADENNISVDDAYSTDDIMTVFELDDEMETATNEISYFSVTRKSEINLIYMEDIAREYESNNYSYEFVGYYAATYNEDGSVKAFINVEDSENWNSTYVTEVREDGLYGGYNYIYSVLNDAEVFALYIERPVYITVTYTAPDNYVSDLATTITLNGSKVITDEDIMIISQSDNQKIFTFKALYNQSMSVVNATTEPYEIDHFVVSGYYADNQELFTYLSDDSGNLTSYEFEVVFTYLKVDVYARTYLDTMLYDNQLYAEITEVVVQTYRLDTITISGDDIYIQERLNSADGNYYNYVLRLPYNSTLIATNITAHLNNFTITAWEIDGTSFSNMTVKDSQYISARLEANLINVKYYSSDGTEIEGFGETSISYGTQITLPYVVVDEDTKISKGWLNGDISYEWGDKIYAVTPNNEEITDGTLKIVADVIDKYYLIFANDGYDFAIDSKYTTKNSVVVATENIEIVGASSYYYYIVADNVCYTREVTDNYVISTEANIPEELQFADDASFGGWLVGSGSVFISVYSFDTNDIVDSTNHLIQLTSTLSGIVSVKFYLTNPTDALNAESDFKFATSASADAEFTIPYIQVFYNKDNQQFFSYVYAGESYNGIMEWDTGYFMLDTLELTTNYTFYGWSATRRESLDIPSTMYSSISADSALLYKWESTDAGMVRTLTDTQTNNNDLLALLQAENYIFYAVWETNKTITFDASDSSYTNGFLITEKYAEGETIELPNNLSTTSENYYNLINAKNKWLGWASTDGAITYKFDDFESGYYQIKVPSQDVTFEPIWTSGTEVYFDINFDAVRNYYAQTMASAIDGIGSATDLLARIGYPYIVADLYEYVASSTTPGVMYVDGAYVDYTYATAYREGNLWCDGDLVPVYKYVAEAFSQVGIFTVHAELDKYFELIGWYYDANGNGICDDGELIEIDPEDETGLLTFKITQTMIDNNNGSVVLHAYWKPIDIEVEFYYDETAASNADAGLRYQAEDEDGYYSTVVISLPFGYKLTNYSDYAINAGYLNTGSIQYMYSGLAASMKNPTNMTVAGSLVDFYRFDHWESIDYQEINFFSNDKTDTYDANTVSRTLINTVRLYPIFNIQYIVQFLSSTGVVISNDITQLVVTGEQISVKPSLESALDTRIIKDVYYLNNVDSRVSLWTDTKVDYVTFDEDTFKIIDIYYVNIYVEASISLRAYIPDYSSSTPTIQQYSEDYDIFQNYTYTLREIFNLTDTTLKSLYGDDSNYPSFGGWFVGSYNDSAYYSRDNSSAYLVNESNALTIIVISESDGTKTTYYAVINNDRENKIALEIYDNGLVVCLYAKLYTTTTVSLGDTSDYEIIKFSTLTYDETDSNIGSKYIITDTTTISEELKSVTYLSAYNSPYSPTFTVDLAYGYRINGIDNISSDYITELAEAVSASNSSYTTDTRFKAILNKSTTTETDSSGIEQMKIKYSIRVAKIIGTNNLNFKIAIDSIKYTVNYSYDNTITRPLQYRVANRSTAPWQSFAEGSGTIVFTGVDPVYNSGIMTYNFAVDYTTSTSGETSTISISGIPYGTSIYLGAFAIDTMLYHFDSWEITVEDKASLSKIGSINEFVQSFAPVLYTTTNYIYDIDLFAVMALNEVKSVTYNLRFDDTYFETGSVWDKLLKSAEISGLSKTTNSNGSVYYTYTWTPVGLSNGLPSEFTGDNVIKAGSSMTALLNTIRTQYYDKQFNSTVAVISSGNKIQTISQLLNYFWFTGIWSTYEKDLSDKICYLYSDYSNSENPQENIIKVSVEGAVTLYTKLEKAVLVNALHQVIDYLDPELYSIITDDSGNRVDRADISLVSVTYETNGTSSSTTVTGVQNTDFYLLGSNTIVGTNYENLAIKLPYGYNVTIKATPDSATSSHTSYSVDSWSLLDCGEGSGRAFELKDTECTLKTAEYSDWFIKDSSSNSTRPELHFYADVMADTYDLILYNEDGNQIGGNISLAYDSGIASIQSGGSQKYNNYDYTLTTLRNNNRLYLFVLDENYINASPVLQPSLIGFRHSADAEAKNYGDYKYLFNYWSKELVGSAYGASRLVKDWSNNVYNDIKLYANYYENVRIDYTLLNEYVDGQDNITISSYYLPNGYFYDEFGNEYSDNLMIITALQSLKQGNNAYVYYLSGQTNRFGLDIVDLATSGKLYIGIPNPSSNGTFNNGETYDEGFVAVDNVSDIVNNSSITISGGKNTIGYGLQNGGYRIYPEIDVNISIREDGVERTDGSYIVRTLGGRYAVSMLDNGKIKFNNIIGLYLNSVSDSNKVANGVINFIGSNTKQFAYWEVWEEDLASTSGISLSFNVSDNPYCTGSSIIIDNHYNVKLTASETDNRGEGSVEITNNITGSNSTLYNLSLTLNNLNAQPSKYYLSDTGASVGDEEIQIQRIAIVKDGYKFYIADMTNTNDISSALIGYTGVYTPADASTTDKFVWKLTFSNRDTVFLYEDGDYHIIEDSEGLVTISPLLFPPEVTLSIRSTLYITNVNSTYQSTYGSLISVKSQDGTSSLVVDGGSIMLVDSNVAYNTYTLSWTTNLHFQPLDDLTVELDSLKYIYATVASSNSTNLRTLANYTTNYRWQFFYDGKWQDVTDNGTTLTDCDDDALEMRIACDWKTVTVNFRVFDTLSEDMLTNTDYNGYSFDNALSANNGLVIATGTYTSSGNTVTMNRADNFTMTLLANDTIAYDVNTETFTITSQGRWTNMTTVKIDVTNVSDLYNQGWLRLTQSEATGKYTVKNMSSSYTNNNLIFAVWLEEKVTKSVVVDKQQYADIVNGYGDVVIEEFKVKTPSSSGILLDSASETEASSGVYLANYVMGVSTKLKLTIQELKNVSGYQSHYDHNFVNISYTKKASTEKTVFASSSLSYNYYRMITVGDLSLDSDISILYDASATLTQYAITDERLNVRYLHDIYGGYTVSYSLSSNVNTIVIKDMFGTIVDRILMYYQTNGTASSSTYTSTAKTYKIYPRYNYYIEALGVLTSKNTAFSITDNVITNYTIPTSLTAVANYTHQDNIARNDNKVLVYMDETLHTIDLDIVVDVESLDASGEPKHTYEKFVDTNKVTIANNSTFSDNYSYSLNTNESGQVNVLKLSRTTSTLLKTTQLGLYYDVSSVSDSKMILALYLNSTATSDSGTMKIKADANYIFKSVGFYDYLNGDDPSSSTLITSCDYYDYAVNSNTLVGTESRFEELVESNYTLVISLKECTETNIAFLSTLPYASDLTNLNMTTTLLNENDSFSNDAGYYAVQDYDSNFYTNNSYISNPINFNMLDSEADILVSGATSNSSLILQSQASTGYRILPSLTTDKGVYVKIGSSGLEFIGKDGSPVGTIGYTLPTIYGYMGNSTGYGWYILEDFATMKATTTYMGYANTSYKYWSVDLSSMTPVTTTAVELKANCTIVLALKRELVTIKVDNGTWWASMNNTTINTPTTLSEYNSVANQDVNSMLTYSKFNSTSCTTLYAAGGLVSAIPMDYQAFYQLDKEGNKYIDQNGEYQLENAYTNATSYYIARNYKTIQHTIRTGIYLTYSDTPVENRKEQILEENNTSIVNYTIKCTYSTFDDKNGVIPAVAILGQDNVDFNIGLTNSKNWAFAGVPSGDSGVGTSTYTNVAFHLSEYDSKDPDRISDILGYDSNTGKYATFNFATDTQTLLQSFVSWLEADRIAYREQQRTFYIYIAKDTTTRLYSGMYNRTNVSNYNTNAINTPSGNSYSRIAITYSNSTLSDPTVPTERIILTGFKIKDSNGKFTNYTYNSFNDSGITTSDFSDFTSSIEIYPVWEIKNCYTVTLVDKYNTSGIGTSSGKVNYILEGRTLTISASLNATKTITNSVSTSATASGSYKTIAYTANSKTYLFAGLTEKAPSNTSTQVYSNGSTDSNYTNYGLMRIVKGSSSSYTLTYNTTRGANNKYTLVFTPTTNTTLYNVWWEYGYTVTYQHNGTVTMGTTGTYSGKELDSYYSVKDTNCKTSVTYGNYLIDMPYLVAYSFSYTNAASGSRYGVDGFSANNYYAGTSGTTSINGTLQFSSTSTIGFSLIHSTGHSSTGGGCMSSTYHYQEQNCSDASHPHTHKTYYEYDCKYCNYDNLTSTPTYVKYSTTAKYQQSSSYGKYNHMRRDICNKCGGVASTSDQYCSNGWYLEQHKNYWSSWTTTTEPTCNTLGEEQRTCSKCGKVESNDIKSLGHDYSSGKEENTATCTKYGYLKKYCSRCNKWIDTEYVYALGHNFSSNIWYVVDGKECTDTNGMQNYCQRCFGNESGGIRYKTGSHSYSFSKYDTEIEFPSDHTDRIDFPDAYHCLSKVARIRFVCRNCDSYLYRDDKNNEDEVMVRIRTLTVYESYTKNNKWTFRYSNVCKLTQSEIHTGYWNLDFNYHCKGTCKSKLNLFETGLDFDYVIEDKSKINDINDIYKQTILYIPPDYELGKKSSKNEKSFYYTYLPAKLYDVDNLKWGTVDSDGNYSASSKDILYIHTIGNVKITDIDNFIMDWIEENNIVEDYVIQ